MPRKFLALKYFADLFHQGNLKQMEHCLQYFLLKYCVRLLFCVFNVVYLYGLQMSVVKHFSVDSKISEIGNMKNVEFQ